MQESDEGGMFKVLVWYVKLKRKQRVSREGGSSKRVSSPPMKAEPVHIDLNKIKGVGLIEGLGEELT